MTDPHMIQHQAYLNDLERGARASRQRPLRRPVAGLVTCVAALGLLLPFVG